MRSRLLRFRNLRAGLVLLLTGLAAALPLRAQEGEAPVVTTDLLRIRQLGSVAVSPDGSRIAYTVRRIVEEEETDGEAEAGDGGDEYGYRTHIYVARSDAEADPQPLTRGDESARNPVWDPAGERIAFVRSVDGTPQIFVLPLEGGEAWQLTEMEHGASAPRWSPDGERILFSSSLPHARIRGPIAGDPGRRLPAWPEERPGREHGDVANWEAEEGDRPAADPDGSPAEIREWLARNAARDDPRVVTRLDFQDERDLDPSPEYSHLYVVEAGEGAEPSPLTRGFRSFGNGRWTPDGSAVVATATADTTRHPDRVLDRDLFRIELEDPEPRLLLDLPDRAVFDPRISPDGRTVAFRSRDLEDPGFSQTELGALPLAGGEAANLTEDFDRSVGAFRWSGDGETLTFAAPAEGGFPLFRIPADGGEAERLTGFDTGVRSLDLEGGTLAYVLTEVANPYELYAAGPDASDARRLSDHNARWLEDRRLSVPEPRELTRPDGRVVDYWIMRPAEFEEGESYPLLLEIHGGPSAMWGPGEATMWHEFQLLAARGYGIVYANPRGSGGYGREFRRANYRDWGEGPTGDVLAAASEAADEPWADPDRQGVTGGSYAGYLTAWIVGHDDRFEAAVAQRGVYDLGTFLGEGNAWRLVPWHFGGFPWEEEAGAVLERESPLTYVEDIRTPLLIIHGDVDLRTGVIQSEVLYRSLKLLERPAEYVRYPNASHELSRSGDPGQRMDRLLRILEFMDRYLME